MSQPETPSCLAHLALQQGLGIEVKLMARQERASERVRAVAPAPIGAAVAISGCIILFEANSGAIVFPTYAHATPSTRSKVDVVCCACNVVSCCVLRVRGGFVHSAHMWTRVRCCVHAEGLLVGWLVGWGGGGGILPCLGSCVGWANIRRASVQASAIKTNCMPPDLRP
jgi:hypothetical protein